MEMGEVMILVMTRVINYYVVGSMYRRMKRWRLIGRTCRMCVNMLDVVKMIGRISRRLLKLVEGVGMGGRTCRMLIKMAYDW
jgi:hypothetical protein